jgi:hypothetical protein
MTKQEKANRISRNLNNRWRSLLAAQELRELLVTSATRHLAGDAASVSCTQGGRIRISTPALKRLDYIAQTFSWMAIADDRHGPQAKEISAKALRALRAARADLTSLESLCKSFRSAKRRYEIVRSEAKPRTARSNVGLKHDWTAARLSTERDLVSFGRKFGNCLAGDELSQMHRRNLRKGYYEYWVISDQIAEPRCLLRVDPDDNAVQEVKGPHNRPAHDSRDAIVDFMLRRRLSSNGCSDLVDLGICNSLLAATASGKVVELELELNGAPWTLYLAPGLLIGDIADHTFMLHGTIADEDCPYQISGFDDYWQQADLRTGLRRICANNQSFSQSIICAFSDAKSVFVEDWFGLTAK